MRRFLEYWLLPETVARALRVAGVVGPILVAINHAEAVLAWEWTPKLLLKVGLTFFVPYAVSSWSSARALMQNSRPYETSAEVDLAEDPETRD